MGGDIIWAAKVRSSARWPAFKFPLHFIGSAIQHTTVSVFVYNEYQMGVGCPKCPRPRLNRNPSGGGGPSRTVLPLSPLRLSVDLHSLDPPEQEQEEEEGAASEDFDASVSDKPGPSGSFRKDRSVSGLFGKAFVCRRHGRGGGRQSFISLFSPPAPLAVPLGAPFSLFSTALTLSFHQQSSVFCPAA